MKLTHKHSFQAKTCSLAAVTLALVTMAASNAAADHVRVFNEKVSGVPAANPVAILPNVLSPEFTAGLVEQGAGLLENELEHPIERQLCGSSGQRRTATFEFALAMGW